MTKGNSTLRSRRMTMLDVLSKGKGCFVQFLSRRTEQVNAVTLQETRNSCTAAWTPAFLEFRSNVYQAHILVDHRENRPPGPQNTRYICQIFNHHLRKLCIMAYPPGSFAIEEWENNFVVWNIYFPIVIWSCGSLLYNTLFFLLIFFLLFVRGWRPFHCRVWCCPAL